MTHGIIIAVLLGVLIVFGYVRTDHESAQEKVAKELGAVKTPQGIIDAVKKNVEQSTQQKEQQVQDALGEKDADTLGNDNAAPRFDQTLAEKYSKATLTTTYGDIRVEFFTADAPQTVANFLTLAQKGFYDGVTFHRVIKDFMIQGGDPKSKDQDSANAGTGGPGYVFPDEINDHQLVRGTLAMANSGPDTNGSQFFIVTKDATPWLDGKYTAFGRVAEGMDVVDQMEAVATDANDRPLENIVVEKITLHEKK